MRVANPLTRVCFPKPFTLELVPKNAPANLPELGDQSPPFDERQRLLREYLMGGFGERAVVVQKHRHSMYYTSPYNWGVIVQATATRDAGQPWKPFLVKWINGSQPSRHNPEELVLLHDALEEREVILRYHYGED